MSGIKKKVNFRVLFQKIVEYWQESAQSFSFRNIPFVLLARCQHPKTPGAYSSRIGKSPDTHIHHRRKHWINYFLKIMIETFSLLSLPVSLEIFPQAVMFLIILAQARSTLVK